MSAQLRHILGFLASGTIAFCIDVGVLHLLTSRGVLPPLAARILAIGAAMVAGWLCHRRLTWALDTPPTLAEFVKYAGLAWGAAVVNYLVFAALVLIAPGIAPTLAVAFSSIVAMAVSYIGMRYGVFRRE